MREITVYEIEEYTVDIDVPVVVPTFNLVTDVQPTVTTVPTVEKVTHSHEVLHDVNFGLSEESQAALTEALVTEVVVVDEAAAEESTAGESATEQESNDEAVTQESEVENEGAEETIHIIAV